jgi:hypothetical protein
VSTSLTFEAPGAVIHATDTPRRTITGRVLTWGEYGNTSLGRKRFLHGSLELPDDPRRVLLLRGHTDGPNPGDGVETGAAVRFTVDGEKLDGEFRVTALPIGDTLLAEADPACPIRGGLSVEVTDLEFDPADPSTVVRGRLKAVAAVPFQAYPSSRMTTVAASAHDTPGDDPTVTAPTTAPAAAEPAAPAAPLDYDRLAAALAPHLTAAAAPAGLPTGALTYAAPAAPAAAPGLAPSQHPRPDEGNLIARAATLQAAIARDPSNLELRAALVDITQSGLSLFDNPSTLGEKLWEGASYTRRFVPLFRQLPLTAMKGTGWRWITRPKIADYAGNKAAIPSNQVSVDQSEWSAERCAAGWDIDRKFRDFGDDQFWTEFYTAQTESYLELSDERAAAALVEYAIDVTADPATWPTLSDGTTAAYALPDGYSSAAGGVVVTQADVLKAAALATAILEDTPRVRRGPDYIVMNTADWLSLMNLTSLDLPAFLALLKVTPENFQRSAQVPKGKIIAGVKPAATFRELGSTPIRVEALDVARGGIDSAVFGYTASHMDKPGGIISVPVTEGA